MVKSVNRYIEKHCVNLLSSAAKDGAGQK
jgi:hypothetical protein